MESTRSPFTQFVILFALIFTLTSSIGCSSDPEDGTAKESEQPAPEARCGDGIVAPETEACDDGNQENGDSCTNDCRVSEGWIVLPPIKNGSYRGLEFDYENGRILRCEKKKGHLYEIAYDDISPKWTQVKVGGEPLALGGDCNVYMFDSGRKYLATGNYMGERAMRVMDAKNHKVLRVLSSAQVGVKEWGWLPYWGIVPWSLDRLGETDKKKAKQLLQKAGIDATSGWYTVAHDTEENILVVDVMSGKSIRLSPGYAALWETKGGPVIITREFGSEGYVVTELGHPLAKPRRQRISQAMTSGKGDSRGLWNPADAYPLEMYQEGLFGRTTMWGASRKTTNFFVFGISQTLKDKRNGYQEKLVKAIPAVTGEEIELIDVVGSDKVFFFDGDLLRKYTLSKDSDVRRKFAQPFGDDGMGRCRRGQVSPDGTTYMCLKFEKPQDKLAVFKNFERWIDKGQ